VDFPTFGCFFFLVEDLREFMFHLTVSAYSSSETSERIVYEKCHPVSVSAISIFMPQVCFMTITKQTHSQSIFYRPTVCQVSA
jgi:hypothetical protein